MRSPETGSLLSPQSRCRTGASCVTTRRSRSLSILLKQSDTANRGRRQLRQIMGNLKASGDGHYQPQNSHAVIDCLSDLVGAVLHAFTAIESLANHSIDQLPDDAAVSVHRSKGEVSIPRDEMVRGLSISEKLELAVPMLGYGQNAKGTAAWERFVHLRRLRDDLVHVKGRGYSTDPDEPSAYGMLMLGAGDDCIEEATVLVLEARPGFLPKHVLAALGVRL